MPGNGVIMSHYDRYYMTADEYIEILRRVIDEVYGLNDRSKCHPEDLYTNLQVAAETINVAFRTLMEARA